MNLNIVTVHRVLKTLNTSVRGRGWGRISYDKVA